MLGTIVLFLGNLLPELDADVSSLHRLLRTPLIQFGSIGFVRDFVNDLNSPYGPNPLMLLGAIVPLSGAAAIVWLTILLWRTLRAADATAALEQARND